MRLSYFLVVGLVALVVTAPQGRTQDGGGNGRRSWSMDPNEFFNRMANGKEVWVRSDITDPRMQSMFDRMAERIGTTNGQITREQFTKNMAQRMAERGGSPGGAPAPAAAAGTPGSQPAANNGNGPEAWAGWAEGMFRRHDVNGDGYLNNDEMPEDLRSERDKWDTDHNGLIDLNEYKAYFQARMQQRMAERGAGGSGGWDGNMGTQPLTVIAPVEEEERKPVVFQVGNLPKELPTWFQALDTDKDAQIGLYEWKVSGRSIKEFQEIDRNNDGFLTVEEVLASETRKKKGASNGTTIAAAGNGGSVSPNAFAGRDSRRRQR